MGKKNAEPAVKVCSLEERISRILRTPELELDGEAYKGKYELNDGKSIKKFILGELRKVYTNFNTNYKIAISNNSAGKLAFHWKDGEAYQKSIVHIPQIIERMQFLDEAKPNSTDLNPMPLRANASKFGEKYHFYGVVVRRGGFQTRPEA
jgi:hypothetical protein